MPDLQDIMDSQKQLEDILGSRMSAFEKLLQTPADSESKPNIEKLTQEFTEFKAFALGIFKLLRSQILSLASQIDELDCSNRRNALLFNGVPETERENCTTVVLGIIQSKLNMPNAQASSIYLCHRLGTKSENRDRPILVRFNNIGLRDAIWREKKLLKSSSTMVCEFLTKTRHELFMAARSHFGLTSCWTSNGAIHIMLPDKNRKRIATELDLNELRAKYPSASDIVVVKASSSSASLVAAAARSKASPKPAGGHVAGTAATEPPQTRKNTAAKSKLTPK